MPGAHAGVGDSLLTTFGLPSFDDPRGSDGSIHAPRSETPGLAHLEGVDVPPPGSALTDLGFDDTSIKAEAAGAAKWQLNLTADRPIIAMSLLRSPTGHLTNLSTAPGRGVGPASDVSDFTAVSAIVQSTTAT